MLIYWLSSSARLCCVLVFRPRPMVLAALLPAVFGFTGLVVVVVVVVVGELLQLAATSIAGRSRARSKSLETCDPMRGNAAWHPRSGALLPAPSAGPSAVLRLLCPLPSPPPISHAITPATKKIYKCASGRSPVLVPPLPRLPSRASCVPSPPPIHLTCSMQVLPGTPSTTAPATLHSAQGAMGHRAHRQQR